MATMLGCHVDQAFYCSEFAKGLDVDKLERMGGRYEFELMLKNSVREYLIELLNMKRDEALPQHIQVQIDVHLQDMVGMYPKTLPRTMLVEIEELRELGF